MLTCSMYAICISSFTFLAVGVLGGVGAAMAMQFLPHDVRALWCWIQWGLKSLFAYKNGYNRRRVHCGTCICANSLIGWKLDHSTCRDENALESHGEGEITAASKETSNSQLYSLPVLPAQYVEGDFLGNEEIWRSS